MPIIQLVGAVALVIATYMTCFFLLAILTRRNDIADIAWGLGFVVVVAASFTFGGEWTQRRGLVAILTLLWGMRLAGHVWMRNKGRREDFRYARWREEWGRHWVWRTFWQVFMLQGLFMLLISAPIYTVQAYDAAAPLRVWDMLGIAVWILGFVFEAVGDYQLSRFKQDPSHKGQLMTRGLWRYTRHPNYFGEVTMWWGVWLIALGARWGGLAVIGPLTITFLILKVSGVPMLEAKYEGRSDWEAYKRRTSVFFPWPPRRID